MPAYVYVLRSQRNGRFYTGFSVDPERRLVEHNSGAVRATRSLRPWEIAYTELCVDETEARKREYQIKSMKSRRYIQWLIETASGERVDPL
jgi:putative endonuclease